MRRALIALTVACIAVLTAAGTTGGDRSARRVTTSTHAGPPPPGPMYLVSLPGGLSIRVPPGWHVLRGRLSDVVDPAPRLAVTSFPARLSRRTCACGFPNVVDFPRDGAFIFVWEYLHPSRPGLARAPARPVSAILDSLRVAPAT